MCVNTVAGGVAVALAVIVVIYGLDALIPGGSYSSDCPDGGMERSCDENPLSRRSCCALNPVIKSQLNTIRTASGCEIRRGVSPLHECICLPNIGSKYLAASIASTRDTVLYHHPLATPATMRTNSPIKTIEPTPGIVGENWHFKGVGYLVVAIAYPSQISGFTVMHMPKCSLPEGYESGAPKNFQVLGMNRLDEDEPFLFGNYTYKLDRYAPAVQVFPVQRCSREAYKFVEFRFLTNHGNPLYTAVYKVRIHGDMQIPPEHSLKANATQGSGNNAVTA